MSYTKERDQFIATMTREGLPFWAIEKLLRIATTLNRLAELACSSEAADRDRIPCPEAQWDKRVWKVRQPKKHGGPCLCDFDGEHHDIPRIALRDWQATQRAERVIAQVNRDLALAADDRVLTDEDAANMRPGANARWRVTTQGDPRGYVLRVVPPSYAERNAGRDRFNLDAIGVPARDSGLRF